MVGSDGQRARVRIVVVGCRPDVRRALEIRLALEGDVTVAGSEASVSAAVPRLRGRGPQVLLVDLDGCPDLSEEALERARSAAPGLRIVLLTHGREAAACGRPGADVVHKGPDAAPLLAAIRRTAQGFV